jgi:TIR domain
METAGRIFLSYSHPDKDWAKELSRYLEKRGFRVFLDDESLLPGVNWRLEVGSALESADAMVVLISPASARALSVQQDIQYALGAERFQDRLIPVEVEPTQDYPWVLRQLEWIKTGGDIARAGDQIARILLAAGEPDVHAGAR